MTRSRLEKPVHPGRKPPPRLTKQAVNASAAPALSASLEASCNVSPDEATSSTIRVRLPLSSGGIRPNIRGERRRRLSRLRRLIRTGWNSQPRALASAPPTKTPPCATPTTASGVNVLDILRARARTRRSNSDQVSSRTFSGRIERSCPSADRRTPAPRREAFFFKALSSFFFTRRCPRARAEASTAARGICGHPPCAEPDPHLPDPGGDPRADNSPGDAPDPGLRSSW